MRACCNALMRACRIVFLRVCCANSLVWSCYALAQKEGGVTPHKNRRLGIKQSQFYCVENQARGFDAPDYLRAKRFRATRRSGYIPRPYGRGVGLGYWGKDPLFVRGGQGCRKSLNGELEKSLNGELEKSLNGELEKSLNGELESRFAKGD